MALVLGDLIQETSDTTGTGPYTLAGPLPGGVSFVSGVGDGNGCYYTVTDGVNFEITYGVATAGGTDTLSRGTVLRSSNGGLAVNWGAGTKTIIGSLPASRLVYRTESDASVIGPSGKSVSSATWAALADGLWPGGSAAAPAWAFSASPGTGFYRESADSIGLAAAGAYVGKINSNGIFAVALVATGELRGGSLFLTGSASLRASPGGQVQISFGPTTNTVAMGGIRYHDPDGSTCVGSFEPYPLRFLTDDVERARFDAAGNFLVGITAGASHALFKEADEADGILAIGRVGAAQPCVSIIGSNGAGGWSWAEAVLYVGKNTTTGRSINVPGTINASGADYAEYRSIIPALYGGVAKGALLGTNAAGLLTDRFADVIGRTYVKSTEPNLTGNDGWGTEANICDKYAVVAPGAKPTDAADPAEQAAWAARKAAFDAARETERVRWDRVAMCGIVPANIAGLTLADIGKYLVPIAAADGNISAVAVAADDLTLEQYIRSFGVVEAIHADGRPLVCVKVS